MPEPAAGRPVTDSPATVPLDLNQADATITIGCAPLMSTAEKNESSQAPPCQTWGFLMSNLGHKSPPPKPST